MSPSEGSIEALLLQFHCVSHLYIDPEVMYRVDFWSDEDYCDLHNSIKVNFVESHIQIFHGNGLTFQIVSIFSKFVIVLLQQVVFHRVYVLMVNFKGN